jgi:hypothetical protein
MNAEAEVTRRALIAMQVCVPADWPDSSIIAFAEKENPCGTTAGWCIRREGHEALKGDPERNPCAERDGFVHVILEA